MESIEEKIHRIFDLEVVKIENLLGDASARQYFRIFSGEQKIVGSIDYSEKADTNFTNFIKKQRLFDMYGICVPKVLFSNRREHIILQEDIGSCLLHDKFLSNGSQMVTISPAIDILVNLHALDLSCFSLKKDEELGSERLFNEIKITHKYFIEKYLGLNLSKDEANKFFHYWQEVIDEISIFKKVLNHRDFHSKNIMVQENGRYVLIDFQDAMKGAREYDLASFCYDCYIDHSEDTVRQIIEYYWKKSLKDELDLETFILRVQKAALQRLYKAIGTFCFLKEEKGKLGYLTYIPMALKKIIYLNEQLQKGPDIKRIFEGFADAI